MALIDTYNLRYNSATLQSKVVAAVAKAAMDILNEDPATANHADRVTWAAEALSHTKTVAEKFMWGVVSNASIAAAGEDATDNDIQFVVNSLIDTIAG